MILKKTSWLSVLFLTLSLQAFHWPCGSDIHQGNIIMDSQIAQLHQGMTLQEVKKLLGTPVLAQNKGNLLDVEKKSSSLESIESDLSDDEEDDRVKLEYVYLYQPRYGQVIRKRISLTFEDEKLTQFRVFT